MAEYGPQILNYAYLVCHDAELAEDAVQTVFARLLDRPQLVEEVTNHAGYLRRAVTNEIKTVLRRRVRLRGLLPKLLERQEPTDPADLVNGRASLWHALGQLPRRQQVAVVLRYYEDLSDEEIAATLGCAPATVRTLLSRALKRLRTHLKEAHDDA